MSEFSEACKRLIEQSDTNVYQISKRSGLDRTTLQKMVQGNRLPSRQFVEELCEYLPINQAEKRELLRLFQMEKIGLDRYYCRCEVENLLCNFRNLKDSLGNPVYRRTIRMERLDGDGGLPPVVRHLSTEVDVFTTIQYVILNAAETDSGRIPVYMDLFPQSEYAIMQILQEDDDRRGRVDCCQFVYFYHRSGSCRGMQKNVQNLRSILSGAFALSAGYEARYFYKTMDEPEMCNPWPHYLVTAANVLLMADDGKSGILIEDADIAAEYLIRMRAMRAEGKSLITFCGSVGEMIGLYNEHSAHGKMTLSFDTMLCMADIIPRLITPEQAADSRIMQDYLALCDRRREEGIFDPEYRRFCCMNGVEHFLKTGVLPGLYGALIGPAPPQRRAAVMRSYCADMESRQNEYLLKEEIRVPAEGLNFELFDPDRVFIYSIQKDLSPCCICIEESGAYEIFRDYFESLEEDGRAYSAEQSRRIVSETCERLIRKYDL